MNTEVTNTIDAHPLYLVTHQDLTAGYQIAQVAHAVADFALHRLEHFVHWRNTDQRILALQTKDSESLEQLFSTALAQGLDVIPFYEPDIDNALTSLAFVPHERNKKLLSKLPLAGRKAGSTNKHSFTTTEQG